MLSLALSARCFPGPLRVRGLLSRKTFLCDKTGRGDPRLLRRLAGGLLR